MPREEDHTPTIGVLCLLWPSSRCPKGGPTSPAPGGFNHDKPVFGSGNRASNNRFGAFGILGLDDATPISKRRNLTRLGDVRPQAWWRSAE